MHVNRTPACDSRLVGLSKVSGWRRSIYGIYIELEVRALMIPPWTHTYSDESHARGAHRERGGAPLLCVFTLGSARFVNCLCALRVRAKLHVLTGGNIFSKYAFRRILCNWATGSRLLDGTLCTHTSSSNKENMGNVISVLYTSVLFLSFIIFFC